MYYEYLGNGISDTNKVRYKIGLNFYMSCDPSAPTESSYNFSIFNRASPYNLITNAFAPLVSDVTIGNCTTHACYPCIDVVPSLCYRIRKYEVTVELPRNTAGFIVSKQRCCRVGNIANIANSLNVGETYSIEIPGYNSPIAGAHINNSPVFVFNDTAVVCGGSTFSLSFHADDPDGDSLHYYFCNALNGGSSSSPDPTTASNPPYASVPYLNPYNGSNPLGSGVTIDPVTGTISGTAPSPGEFVATVCVGEYRNGQLLATTRKEVHIRVANCTQVKATLDPTFTTCGDFTLNFSNQTDNVAITTWMWVFGDPSSGSNDTSYLQYPSHTFSDAGDYTIKLFVNRGSSCADSTEQLVHVYPGFFPGFTVSGPYCTNVPVQFTDTTRTNYGVVNSWSWNFGVTGTTADTSHDQHPSYTFQNPGTYTINLISGNSKGCIDTATSTTITVLAPPALDILNGDTSICYKDSIQLTATGTGNFNWSPNIRIINATTAMPTVFPQTPTTYHVALEQNGCISKDSVTVNPLSDLTNDIAANPTSICEEDTLTLTGSSNRTSYLSWQWSPVASIESPNAQTTRAYPVTTTTYTLKTTWGSHCTSTKTITIPVTPLAIPDAGTPGYICSGQTTMQLNASGGDNYKWTPAAGLSDRNIPNPIANPATTTTYVVAVGVNGCPKKRVDSVTVTVYQRPVISLPGDTLICSIDTLPIHLTGSGNIQWSPNYNINSLTTADVLVSPDLPTTYHVTVTDSHGCFSTDSTFVDVKLVVSLDAGNDTSICRSEGFLLNTVSDGLHYNWSPSTGLNSDTLKHPMAKPLVSTTYTVIANIGKCQSIDSVHIIVAPYPIPYAGVDTAICIGYDGQLHATGGSIYTWTPTQYLSNPNIQNPLIIQPQQNTSYVVTVGDTLGCTKTFKDTVLVRVIPILHVDAGPSDTTIVAGQPVHLHATGAQFYTWSPNIGLSSNSGASVIASPDHEITYTVVGSDQYGCKNTDTIHVKVYHLPASIYVPTAFTPNGDGLNDVIRPILLGVPRLNYFRVYNRWGQLLFQTSQVQTGWDGNYNGRPQDIGNYTWIAEGVTFEGRVITKKGYFVLIR